jgi:hypothetical protein
VRGSAPPGAAGSLTSTGTSLLDYKMGVPVARPHGGLDGRRKEKNCECENICQCNNTCECDTPFSSALDMDGLSAEILKMCGSAVVEWNSASMLEAGPGSPSVQEKGSKHDKKNYCPESLLPAGSKILEDVVRSQLEKHLKKWGIIPREQHGFRAARSTSTAAQCLVHDCCDMKNKGKEVGLVLFDLSSAFDLVDASILVEKLKIYGVGETACKWVLSYMFGRRQLVQIGQSQSSLQPISYGVPQEGHSCLYCLWSSLQTCQRLSREQNWLSMLMTHRHGLGGHQGGSVSKDGVHGK